MASIADVAKHAGVSVATVSRVINNTGKVQPETKAKVETAISMLSYEPNVLARNFRKVESKVILIISPNITNPYYNRIITGIFDQARSQGYNAFINTAENKSEQELALNMIASKQADGAIFLAAETGSPWLEKYYQKHPMVLCSEYDPDTKIPHICIDNYQAGRDIMEHFISHGHRKIATISSENNYFSTQLRLAAYIDVLKENSIEINPDYIFKASKDYSFKSGKSGGSKLLGLKEPPTAVFCISDMLALGCIVGATDLSLKVPSDLSVMGFDDVENTTMLHPYISTISQPCYEIGVQSAKNLIRQIKGDKTSLHTSLEHKLILRESVANPKM